MVAVVTGGSRGIGLDIVKGLLRRGYRVTVAARSISDGVEELIADYGDDVMFVPCDIGDESDRERVMRETQDTFGDVTLLVNNAGVAPRKRQDMLDITPEDYDYVCDINLRGTYFMCQAAARSMIRGGKGVIINIGSVSSEAVSLNRAEYCISKAGVDMVTKLFAVRLAEYGIGVFQINPGVIDTDMIAPVKAKYESMAESGDIPACRLGKASDVTNIVLALAGGAVNYSTGSVFECGGGLHIPRL